MVNAFDDMCRQEAARRTVNGELPFGEVERILTDCLKQYAEQVSEDEFQVTVYRSNGYMRLPVATALRLQREIILKILDAAGVK